MLATHNVGRGQGVGAGSEGEGDNYIRKTNYLPYGLILLETYDAYDYFQDEEYKLYGSMNGVCSKTMQCKCVGDAPCW